MDTRWLHSQRSDHAALDVSCQHPSPIAFPSPHPHPPLPALTAPPLPQVPVLKPMDLMVEVSPRRVFANGHTYHINSISVNSDCETYMSADDLRINLWHLAITDRSFSILSCRGPAANSAGWAPQVRHPLACCKRAGSGAAALFHPFSRVPPGSQCGHHDEFIYENFKTAVAEGYL